jgi:uncharacterized cupin superfamily protein
VEGRLEQTEAGLVPAGPGWFVLNALDARWIRRVGRGYNAPLTGCTDEDAEAWFPQLGLSVAVLGQGEPMAMYHRENDQEDFLVLSGEALLLVEGDERPLRQWDFVHCPPGVAHTILGAGDRPCVVIAVGAREHQTGDWGVYVVDELALRHGAGVEAATTDATVAYARFPPSQPVPYPGVLPQ